MDVNGRLHMPGFVGETFEETGVKKEIEALPVLNRHERRRLEALERQRADLKAKVSAGGGESK